MRFIVAFVIALATAGCGVGCGDTTSDTSPDLAMPGDCHTTINEGDSCDPACHYFANHCSCSTSRVWVCQHPDMTMHD